MYFATTMGSSKGTWLGWETMKIPLPLEEYARSGHYSLLLLELFLLILLEGQPMTRHPVVHRSFQRLPRSVKGSLRGR